MNKFKIVYDKKVLKQISKLGHAERLRIKKWLDENIEGTSNPRKFGKALTGTLGDLWRYRIGKYRVVVKIKDNELLVLAVKIATRGDAYER